MKNKILSISFILLLLSFVFINNNVFATDNIITTTLPSISEYVSDNDKWFVYYSPNTSTYYLCFTDSSVDIKYRGNYNADNNFNSSSYNLLFKGRYSVYFYKLINNSWNLHATHSDHDNLNIDFSYSIKDFICASNFNLYNDDILGNNDLVFQKTPALSTLKGMNFQKTIVGVFQTMISGMIPYLIVFLVGLVAFLKAWRFLSKELRKG